MTQITNYENDIWRQVRLHRVMSGMIAQHDVEAVCNKIAKLHDHKGILQVQWIGDVNTDMAKTLSQLWEINNEPADSVQHQVG